MMLQCYKCKLAFLETIIRQCFRMIYLLIYNKNFGHLKLVEVEIIKPQNLWNITLHNF